MNTMLDFVVDLITLIGKIMLIGAVAIAGVFMLLILLLAVMF